MKPVVKQKSNTSTWPDPWRFTVIAVCTLVLCSCRSNPSQQGYAVRGGEAPNGGLPAEAYGGPMAASAAAYQTAAMSNCPMDELGMDDRQPMPQQAQGPWAPPGLRQPWPEDEYLRDGGDEGLPVKVAGQSRVLGLEMEDTVAHYQTRDGRTVVQASNEVHIYSPRFGAVRQVVGAMASEERQKATGVHEPLHLSTPESRQIVAGAKQNIQTISEVGANPAVALRSKQGDGIMSNAVGPRGFQDRFKAFENLAVVRMGTFEGSEMAMLARGSTAAIAWSHEQSVQVLLDHQNVTADVKYDQSMSVYTISTPPGKPQLQLVKVASTAYAKPGEEVEFTLRFDNIGDEVIGNVTIVDSLSTRLEYVPETAQCSVEAQFTTQTNEGDSIVLRCALTSPLEPGHGGIVRFRCRVR